MSVGLDRNLFKLEAFYEEFGNTEAEGSLPGARSRRFAHLKPTVAPLALGKGAISITTMRFESRLELWESFDDAEKWNGDNESLCAFLVKKRGDKESMSVIVSDVNVKHPLYHVIVALQVRVANLQEYHL